MRSPRDPSKTGTKARMNEVSAPSGSKSAATSSVSKSDRAESMRDLGGSKYSNWNSLNSNLVQMALPKYLNPDGTPLDMQEISFAGLMSIDPQDVIEGMLAAQMIACHHATMVCYRRTHLPDQTHEGRSEALSHAGKLSRTYATLVEALNRHRGKGQQKVTVEHVHVHKGGQAIVGNVSHPGGGVLPKARE